MARPATADTPQAREQRAIQVRGGSSIFVTGARPLLFGHRLRIPQVDVQPLDLFDQQENRLSGRAKLMILLAGETGSPATELLDLVLVQTPAQGCLPPSLTGTITPFVRQIYSELPRG